MAVAREWAAWLSGEPVNNFILILCPSLISGISASHVTVAVAGGVAWLMAVCQAILLFMGKVKTSVPVTPLPT